MSFLEKSSLSAIVGRVKERERERVRWVKEGREKTGE